MNVTTTHKSEQAEIWNGPVGQGWVQTEELLNRVFAPFADLVVEAVGAAAARRVLDVGCGTGATTRAIARSLRADGCCVGLDISEPMIGAARARAARERVPAQFIVADAETHVFEPPRFDMIVSRFGVMFFADPVRAFANLRRASAPGGQLWLLAWRGIAENPFMTTAERAAAPLLPNLPPRRPDEAGQFAFADDNRVRGILEQSGWSDIDIRPVDVACAFPERGLVGYLTRLGPVGRVLSAADQATRERVVAAIRPAFEPYVHGDEVQFDAACWSIAARSGSV
jgi:SAM-dependent methyltransferase